MSSKRIKSLNAISDNPVHNRKGEPDSVSSDMLGLKSTLEQKFYGKTFNNDNIHIQIIYNILDIEKILAQYSTNAVYALHNLLREDKSENTDFFGGMTTDNTYAKTNDNVNTFIEDFAKNPRLAYFGSAFFVSKDKHKKLRDKKEIYDILALIGKLRHWCMHGDEINSKWLYELDSIDHEFHYIMDKLYYEAINRINYNFVKTNKVNISDIGVNLSAKKACRHYKRVL